MSKTVGTYEAKAKFSSLIHAVEGGQTVIITRNGKKVAKMVPYTPSRRRKRGSMKDCFGKMANDFNAPLDDFAEYQ